MYSLLWHLAVLYIYTMTDVKDMGQWYQRQVRLLYLCFDLTLNQDS